MQKSEALMRLEDELAQLNARREALRSFVNSPDYGALLFKEQTLMVKQSLLMAELSQVLHERVQIMLVRDTAAEVEERNAAVARDLAGAGR